MSDYGRHVTELRRRARRDKLKARKSRAKAKKVTREQIWKESW